MNQKSSLIVVVCACFLAALCLPLVYLLSTGPVIWLMHKQVISTEVCNAYIRPAAIFRLSNEVVLSWCGYWTSDDPS
jgi:hypothetical protein